MSMVGTYRSPGYDSQGKTRGVHQEVCSRNASHYGIEDDSWKFAKGNWMSQRHVALISQCAFPLTGQIMDPCDLGFGQIA